MDNLIDQTTAETDAANVENAARPTIQAVAENEVDARFPGSLFKLGRTVATPGALDALHEACGAFGAVRLAELMKRHNTGDWGQIDPEDRGINEQALNGEARIVSVYEGEPKTLWIITEWDRSYTTVLLPEEY